MTEPRPPLPPFDLEGAIQKVQAAEDGWNSRDPNRVALAYAEDSVLAKPRLSSSADVAQIIEFLTAKWERELDYVLRKSLWGFRLNRIAVRFQYEWHDAAGQWYRSYGNELWEFDDARSHESARSQHQRREDRRVRSGAYFGPRPESEYGARHPAVVT